PRRADRRPRSQPEAGYARPHLPHGGGQGDPDLHPPARRGGGHVLARRADRPRRDPRRRHALRPCEARPLRKTRGRLPRPHAAGEGGVKQAINALRAVYLRELAAYFLTPLAYVFIAIFLIALGAFTFQIGRFFDTNQADLAPFFLFHPWLYLVFLPAVAMRLWADETRGGTLELLLTLPAPTWSIVLGKFLAAWTVALAALLLTTPMWMSVAWLGHPDHAAIAL